MSGGTPAAGHLSGSGQPEGVRGSSLPSRRGFSALAASLAVLFSCARAEAPTPTDAYLSTVTAPPIFELEEAGICEETPPAPQADDSDIDLLPLDCRWNLTGTYAASLPISRTSRAVRYEAEDDGTKLILTERDADSPGGSEVCEARDSTENSALSADSQSASLEFIRRRSGFAHRAVKSVRVGQGGKERVCDIAFEARIVACSGAEIVVELEGGVRLDSACGIAERLPKDKIRLLRVGGQSGISEKLRR